MSEISKQVTIIHLSDIHYGAVHRFDPPQTPSGDRGNAAGYPSLIETLRTDWIDMTEPSDNVVIAVTGDLTFKASAEEFDKAKELLENLTSEATLGCPITKDRIFIIPGNHDVTYEETNKGRRWQPYSNFYQNFYRSLPGRHVYSDNPEALSRIHNRSQDLGIIIAELNSCVFVQKGSPDEHRGQIDLQAIREIRNQLSAIPDDEMEQSIRVAMIHHHPILIPAFAEPDRAYDAVLNSGHLLKVLREFGFHLVLHGHKHYPHTFSYDASCSWITDESGPIMIVAGGSAGSTALPTDINAVNTYNILTVKWNWRAKEARVSIRTRGLQTSDAHGNAHLPGDWRWVDLRGVDRVLRLRQEAAQPVVHHEAFNPSEQSVSDSERKSVYANLRGNMPVVEIVPSLNPNQEYEARLWIEPHKRREEDVPTEVTWSGGPLFEPCRCYYDENEKFRATFNFYGPVLFQAQIRFADGSIVSGHVYAHMPGD